ncbi:MAG: hypothetical protein RI826_09640, partial [Chlorobium phaeovibrioides]|nr:hypothetical protein [Chlorobium phaeovibrioides]
FKGFSQFNQLSYFWGAFHTTNVLIVNNTQNKTIRCTRIKIKLLVNHMMNFIAEKQEWVECKYTAFKS